MLGTLLVTQTATSVYLHRGLAHRALKLHPFADWVFFNKGTLGRVVGIAAAILVLGPAWGLLLAVSRQRPRPLVEMEELRQQLAGSPRR